MAYRKNTWEIRIYPSMLENHSFPKKVIKYIVYLPNILYIVYLPNILFAFQIYLSQRFVPKGTIKRMSF